MMTMKKYVMASLLIGGMLVGNAHALGGFSNPVTSFVDNVVDTAVDVGGEVLNAAGVDNDCDGSSVADHFCQAAGGADAVNNGISTGIQVAGSAYLGGGSAWDAVLDYGQNYLEEAALDHLSDSEYGEYVNHFNNLVNGIEDGEALGTYLQDTAWEYLSESEYDEYINGYNDLVNGIENGEVSWDAVLKYSQDYLGEAAEGYLDEEFDLFEGYYNEYYRYAENYGEEYYGDYYDTYNSLSDSYDTYNAQYQDLAGSYDYYGDNYGRKLLKA